MRTCGLPLVSDHPEIMTRLSVNSFSSPVQVVMLCKIYVKIGKFTVETFLKIKRAVDDDSLLECQVY